ncbi:hypothetical protein MRX96_044707 [Rhipicephalus microplus]
MLGEWTVFLVSEDLEGIVPSFNRRGAIGLTLFCFLFITGALFEVRRVSAELDAVNQRQQAEAIAGRAARNASQKTPSLLVAVPADGVFLDESNGRGREFLEPADVAERAEEYEDRPPLQRQHRRYFGARRGSGEKIVILS